MYCYKCGVKLEDNESKCPLCHTKVHNIDDESNPYDSYVENFQTRVNIKYLTFYQY